MRSGWIGLLSAGNAFWHAGAGGAWWSSRAYSNGTYAYVLYIQLTGAIDPLLNSERYIAFPLRCLSTVLDM